MGCSAVKAEIAKCPEHIQSAAERHLHCMERFRAKVERAPHRFTDLVDRYRAFLDESKVIQDELDEMDEMVSVYF